MREKGRSMVEMLGVLSIIGVLSVGSIAGYSKAMMKYKLNKQTDYIYNLLGYMVTNPKIFSSSNSYNYISLLQKLELIDNYENGYCKDPFNNMVNGEVVIQENQDPYMYLSVFLIYNSEEKSNSDHIILQCVNLLKAGKELSSLIDYIKLDNFSQILYGNTECTKLKNLANYCLKNMTISNIYDVCRSVKQAKMYRVIYYFNTRKI